MREYLYIMFLFLIIPAAAQQDVNIVPYLKQIESGDKESVIKLLPDLKSKNQNNSSLIFLEAIITEDASKAVTLFNEVLTKYPESKYADASVYRLSSYYYASGDYQKAANYSNMLKKQYPNSPYNKLTDERVPNNSNIKGSKTTSVDYKFTIQAGAFSNKENAESLRKEFKESGYTSILKEKTIAGSVFHIVYVGKFVTEEEAKNYLVVINKQLNLDGRVVAIE